jgi:flagellar hook protein FlgE
MFTSFSTALSALDADSTALSVMGNNLANVNTPGYKASVVYFRDLVTRSIGAGLGETQVGFGTAQPSTIREFTQGAIQASSGTLDAAIQGDGFFVIKDDAGQTMYTRAGNFKTDANGVLLTSTGERVQGWSMDPTTGKVNTTVAASDIVVPIGSVKPPIATQNFTLDLNLNSAATVTGSPDLSYPITVYDQLGGSHVVTANFTKTGDNTWHYDLNVPDSDVDMTDPSASTGTSGDLTFTKTGQLDTTTSPATVSFTLQPLHGGAPPLSLTWKLLNGGCRQHPGWQCSRAVDESRSGRWRPNRCPVLRRPADRGGAACDGFDSQPRYSRRTGQQQFRRQREYRLAGDRTAGVERTRADHRSVHRGVHRRHRHRVHEPDRLPTRV